MNEQFIAHDFCGWDEQYGRYTHMPSGETLICKQHMGQLQWDKAQLEFLLKYPGMNVYSCPNRYWQNPNTLMGSTEEICERLKART